MLILAQERTSRCRSVAGLSRAGAVPAGHGSQAFTKTPASQPGTSPKAGPVTAILHRAEVDNKMATDNLLRPTFPSRSHHSPVSTFRAAGSTKA